jgi:hypothetical protein
MEMAHNKAPTAGNLTHLRLLATNIQVGVTRR